MAGGWNEMSFQVSSKWVCDSTVLLLLFFASQAVQDISFQVLTGLVHALVLPLEHELRFGIVFRILQLMSQQVPWSVCCDDCDTAFCIKKNVYFLEICV